MTPDQNFKQKTLYCIQHPDGNKFNYFRGSADEAIEAYLNSQKTVFPSWSESLKNGYRCVKTKVQILSVVDECQNYQTREERNLQHENRVKEIFG